MDDLISRKALLEILEKHLDGIIEENGYQEMADGCDQAIEIVRGFSPVEAAPVKDKWIPVTERLPESERKYDFVDCIVTVMRSHWPTSSYDICDSPYDEYLVMNAMYDVTQKIWHIGDMTQLNALLDIEDSPLNGDYVVAWMPLPEPYRSEEVEQ